jgi:putative phage-type endonuclease
MIKKLSDEDLPQGSQIWLDTRKKYGTASEAAAACEVSPWIPKSRLQLWELKNGELAIKQNFAMRIGHQHEDEAKDWFQQESGKMFEPICIIDDETFGMPLMASLDGQQVFGGTDILEIKVPLNGGCSPLWDTMANNEALPVQYQMQMEQQMMLSGEMFCHFVVYDWKLKKGIHRIHNSDADIRRTIIEGWTEYFKGKPEAGPLDIVKRDDEEWTRISSMWKESKKLSERYTEQAKMLRQDLIDMCGSQSYKGNGVRCRQNIKTGAWTVGVTK